MAKKNKATKRRPRRVGFPPRFFSTWKELRALREWPKVVCGKGVTLKRDTTIKFWLAGRWGQLTFGLESPTCEFRNGDQSDICSGFDAFNPTIHLADIHFAMRLFRESGAELLSWVINDEAKIFLERDGEPRAPAVDIAIVCRSYRSSILVPAEELEDFLTVKW